MNCKERMEAYLNENGVPFEVKRHSIAYTMPEVAAALHESGKHVAKVVMVVDGEQMAMCVIPSACHLDLARVRELTGLGQARLAQEHEFSERFADCAPGAMPPFGNLYGLPVYVDRALAEQAEMVFLVGTHQESAKIAYGDFGRLVQPIVGEFAYME
jgi:Ala-tRNA(Pro) deacylase